MPVIKLNLTDVELADLKSTYEVKEELGHDFGKEILTKITNAENFFESQDIFAQANIELSYEFFDYYTNRILTDPESAETSPQHWITAFKDFIRTQ